MLRRSPLRLKRVKYPIKWFSDSKVIFSLRPNVIVWESAANNMPQYLGVASSSATTGGENNCFENIGAVSAGEESSKE